MNIKEKFIIRSSILELAETGIPRDISIDEKIRLGQIDGEMAKTGNLWNCITALGAQLSRPPYDPYREIIELDISIGRSQCLNKVILSMPLIIYDNDIQIDETTLESLHVALNRLKVLDNTNLGLISENRLENRNYPHFRRINTRTATVVVEEEDGHDAEGLVFQCDDEKSLQFLTDIRKKFDGPILVEVDDSFERYLEPVLNAGADGIIANTIKIVNKSKYKEKHAIKVIHDIRCAINQYYAGEENDGAVLVVAGDVNNTGGIVKAAALGADIIGYSTSLLIANAAHHYENQSNVNTVSDRIRKHMMATKGELKGVPAALGYSNFYNLSSADLRTSSIEASIQAEIAIEGTNTTYRQTIEEFVNKYTVEEELDLNKSQKQELVEYLLRNR
ncbi:hypothetical protein [Candidatus Nitrosocosmicus arcticus]|uniref:Glutamate synthase domain small domain protein n=1 Tax=Candidatus Nitrosocosmicus arcticus TaxID=2035267 RepID=A0A557SUY2_9ARCH|nr:hypothetical protein [Candidatus Nitrosocosmicus arcticus]TVP40406.1 Glutamate synthase domain small domain protein [Candidatus Nitrosocosmicus arcticus]